MRGFTIGFGPILIRCGSLLEWKGLGSWQWTGWTGRSLTQQESRYFRSYLGGRLVRWLPQATTTFAGVEWSVTYVGPFTVLIEHAQPRLTASMKSA